MSSLSRKCWIGLYYSPSADWSEEDREAKIIQFYKDKA